MTAAFLPLSSIASHIDYPRTILSALLAYILLETTIAGIQLSGLSSFNATIVPVSIGKP